MLGASSLMSARNQYIVEGAAEDVVANIRELQSKSITVTGGHSAWGVHIMGENNGLQLIHINSRNTGGNTEFTLNHSDEFIKFPGDTIIKFLETEPAASDDSFYVLFVAPFGTTHITASGCEEWTEDATKPTKEIKPGSTCLSLNDGLRLEIAYRGHKEIVAIDKRGNAHVE